MVEVNHVHPLIVHVNRKEAKSMWRLGRFSSIAACTAGLFMISAYPAMGATGKI